MKAYQYNNITFEYTGYTYAQLDPVATRKECKNIYILPANATFVEVNEEVENKARIFDTSKNEWTYVEDYRGKQYWFVSEGYYGMPHIMEELGPLPTGASLIRPDKSFEEARTEKYNELAGKFSDAEKDAHLLSSLGFLIDANDRANRDINGLITKLSTEPEGTTVDFCDYNNEFHAVTKENCETMLLEIVENGQYLYEQKWTFRNSIKMAKTIKEIEALEFEFKYLNEN